MPHDDHVEFPLGEATARVASAPVGEPAGGAGGADLPGSAGWPVGSGDRVTAPASDALRAVLSRLALPGRGHGAARGPPGHLS
ncbi:hypothetical protein [Streptomyces rimosus]|uniref:hypothetical protein n=1 Tax=Streptomyces rimosus TaxID=1927 RepID=UPI000AA69790|nr:hypothetical protein [Streptomyces rimosus]